MSRALSIALAPIKVWGSAYRLPLHSQFPQTTRMSSRSRSSAAFITITSTPHSRPANQKCKWMDNTSSQHDHSEVVPSRDRAPRMCRATSSSTRPNAKIYGAGEWYVSKHGIVRGDRRTWCKLHLSVEETTNEIVTVDLTTSGVDDELDLPELPEHIGAEVRHVSCDKASDSWPYVWRPSSGATRQSLAENAV